MRGERRARQGSPKRKLRQAAALQNGLGDADQVSREQGKCAQAPPQFSPNIPINLKRAERPGEYNSGGEDARVRRVDGT